nr:PepSY-associated TM helix domain-containing protein [Luteolibacter marinus]
MHSIVGLAAGVGLLVIGLSGSLLVFHEEIDALRLPEQTRVEPTAAGRLPLDELVAAVEKAAPGHAVTGWRIDRDNPHVADGVFVMPFGTREWHYLTIDSYRADVLSRPTDHESTLKHWLLDLHTEFFVHDIGMAVAGLLGVALCFLGLSGLWLYRRFWKSLLRLRWKSSLRMLAGDFHRMVGIFSVGFNLLLGFTGAWWNLSHVVEDLTGQPADPADEVLFHEKLFPASLQLAALPEKARQHIEGFETRYISFPWAPGGPFTLWGSHEDAAWFRSDYGSQVAFDSQSGDFLSAHDLTRDGTWKQIEDAFEPLHFGNFGGLVSKSLWAAAGFAPALLCLSGMAIWWQRRRRTG